MFRFAFPLVVFFLVSHLAPDSRMPRLDQHHPQAFSLAWLHSCLRLCVYVAWRDACRSRVTSARHSKSMAITSISTRSSLFSGPAPIVHSALASATSNSRWAFRVWRCALGNHRCPHHTPRCLGCLCAAMLPKVCPNIWPCGPEKVDRTPAPLAHMNAVLPRSLRGPRMLRRCGQGGSRARAAASECVGALRCRYSRCWCISGWCEVGAPALTAVV